MDLEQAVMLRRNFMGNLKVVLPDPVERIFYPKTIPVDEVKSLWEKYLENKNSDHSLSFYIHIPFCPTRCSFCNCFSRVVENADEPGDYVDNLIQYLYYFKDTFQNVAFENLYIGGGTPDVLSDIDLKRILDFVFSNFNFEKDGQICSELNPGTATLSKLKILKDYGFNRVSFGVQSLNQGVLKLNNRGYQNEDLVRDGIMNAKRVGFKYINVDLIVGLSGDRPEYFIESFRKLVDLRPQNISVYSLQVRPEYLNDHFGSDGVKFNSFWQSLLNDSLTEISRIAKENNFSVPDYSEWYLKMPSSGCWSYHDLNIEGQVKQYIGDTPNHSIFGAGQYSISKIESVMRYRTEGFSKNVADCCLLGTIRNERIEMLDHLTRTLARKNSVSLSEFERVFHKNLLDEFQISIERLKKLEAVIIRGDNLIFIADDKGDRALQSLLLFSDNEIRSAIEFRRSQNHDNYKKTA